MTEVEHDRADMRRLQGGDASALDPLMERWQLRLRTYLMRHGLSDVDACDLAQESFVRVFKHASKFDPRRTFSTWMFQIALNLMRDQRRRQVRQSPDPVEPFLANEPCDSPAPSDETEKTEITLAVQAAVLDLPTNLREVVVLAHYQHLSQQEIATIVGTSIKGVETRLYRARQALKKSLGRWL